MAVSYQKKHELVDELIKVGIDLQIIEELLEHKKESRIANYREPINDNGFDFYSRKSLVIKKSGKEIELDPDETLFLLNELRIMLSNDEEVEEEND